jgi:hypothetical protein
MIIEELNVPTSFAWNLNFNFFDSSGLNFNFSLICTPLPSIWKIRAVLD